MSTKHAAAPAQRPASGRDRSAGRIVILDGLRILAASMVVLYHYVAATHAQFSDQGQVRSPAWWGEPAGKAFPYLVSRVASYGWTGVDLFFLISGFVILMSGWGRKPADFFVSRVVRLVPGYWAGIVISVIVLVALPKLTTGITVRQLLANLTMVQGATGQKNIEPAFWTLLVELKFYLLFGLVAARGVTYKRVVAFCVLWTLASLAAVSSSFTLLSVIVQPKDSPYFIAGMAFYLIYRFGGNAILWGIVTFSWLLMTQVHNGQSLRTDVLLTFFFVLMGIIATHRADGIRWRWLTVAGAITYPLYLIHQDLGFTVFAYLHGTVPPLVLVTCTYVTMLAIAWLIYRLIERPVAGPLKRRLMAAVGAIREGGPEAMAAATGGGGNRVAPAAQRAPVWQATSAWQAAPPGHHPAGDVPPRDDDAMSRTAPS